MLPDRPLGIHIDTSDSVCFPDLQEIKTASELIIPYLTYLPKKQVTLNILLLGSRTS